MYRRGCETGCPCVVVEQCRLPDEQLLEKIETERQAESQRYEEFKRQVAERRSKRASQ